MSWLLSPSSATQSTANMRKKASSCGVIWVGRPRRRWSWNQSGSSAAMSWSTAPGHTETGPKAGLDLEIRWFGQVDRCIASDGAAASAASAADEVVAPHEDDGAD